MTILVEKSAAGITRVDGCTCLNKRHALAIYRYFTLQSTYDAFCCGPRKSSERITYGNCKVTYGKRSHITEGYRCKTCFIDFDYGKLNNNDGANGYRDYGRVNWAGKSYNNGTLALEHTMYTNSDNIANYISSQNVDMSRTYNSTFFNFVDYRLGTTRDLSNSMDSAYSDKYGPVVSDGQYIEIVHSQSYKTRFIYDEATNQYKMQQNYSDGQWRDTVDEAADNKVLTFPNVIVLYTDIHTYPGHEKTDLQYVEYAWGGVGYYCYGGKCEKIYWQKGTPLEALRLYYLNEDGTCSDTPLEVNIGKSYVAVVDVDEASRFGYTASESTDGPEAATEETYVESAD